MSSAHFSHDPASVRQARAFVADVLGQASEEQRERAVLITSELATNAVIHADSAFTVTTTTTAEEIHVAVADAGGAIPLLQRPDQDEVHGRGLLITNGLADRWGVEIRSGGTTVWFALALTSSPAGGPAQPVAETAGG
jgi:anti-sigma regulatory factor (Ser/Thr protein kinase)